MKTLIGFLLSFALLLSPLAAQATGALEARVTDPSGKALAGAQLLLGHRASGFQREAYSDSSGRARFSNLPFQTYHLIVVAEGFEMEEQTVSIRSNIPRRLDLTLQIQGHSEEIEVRAFTDERLVDPEETGTRHQISLGSLEQIPLKVGNRGLEGILLSFPGFSANANGAIHPRGAHNQMTYVIDGMPISDQLTGSFASALDVGMVETIELFSGNVPPEYGNKVSAVANITTRSGMATDGWLRGQTEVSVAGFDTVSNRTQLGGGNERFGYFVSTSLFKSHRFLDQVSLDNLHNGGNAERLFLRLDFRPSDSDHLRFNFMSGRSSFQIANLRSQHAAGQDQRRRLDDTSFSVGWVRALGVSATYDSSFSLRKSRAALIPSLADRPVTAEQNRRLSTWNIANRFSWNRREQTLRLGFDVQHFPFSEDFQFAITDPAFNHPESQDFNPNLLAHDLTRGGSPFSFQQKDSGSLWTLWLQDLVRLRSWTLNLGFRYDLYRFLVHANQFQPRLGIAYHLASTDTVFRLSYSRLFQTPPNENLLLASSRQGESLAPPSVREALGGGIRKIRPQAQNMYEAGIQQALGRHLSLHASFYHKNSRDLQDNDNFFNTGIIFPTSLDKSRVNGFEMRASLLPLRGISGSLSLTHSRIVVTPPFTGGLFLGNAAVDALSSGPFIIDHDQALSAHALLHYRLDPNWATSWSVRHDSGLVSNPSDPAKVALDPDFSDLLPHVDLASDPPRVTPRTIVDMNLTYTHFSGDARKWEAEFQVSNLFDRTALYNFQSIFVGTRLVQPRTAGLSLRFFW